MDTTYNIRDFIVNGLPKEKRDEFMADVNEILKHVQVSTEVLSSEQLHKEWFAESFSSPNDIAMDAFAEKWYHETPARWSHTRFVFRNLHASKRIGYCVTDGKLF